MDAYSFSSGRHIATFHAPLGIRHAKQVAIDQSSVIVLQGSDKGIVYVSDIHTAAPIQTLLHSKVGESIQAVTVSSLMRV